MTSRDHRLSEKRCGNGSATVRAASRSAAIFWMPATINERIFRRVEGILQAHGLCFAAVWLNI